MTALCTQDTMRRVIRLAAQICFHSSDLIITPRMAHSIHLNIPPLGQPRANCISTHASYLSLRQSACCNSRTGLELISQFLCESELVSADIFSSICAQTCEISFLVLNIS